MFRAAASEWHPLGRMNGSMIWKPSFNRLNDDTVPIEHITFTDKGKAFLKHGGDESIVNIVNAHNKKAC